MKEARLDYINPELRINKPTLRTWVIVPAKPLAEAKSRLAPVLTIQQRQRLAFHLLEHTLTVLAQFQQEHTEVEVVVVSSDSLLLKLATKYRMAGLYDTSYASEKDANLRLNKAIAQAVSFCATSTESTSLLILPADLPLLQLADLLFVLDTANNIHTAKKFLINSNQACTGTNALFLQPANLLSSFQFGPESLAAHLAQAQAAGVVAPQILNLPDLLFDLDSPADFAKLTPALQQNLLTPIPFF